MRQPCALSNVVDEINNLNDWGLSAVVADDKLRRLAIDAARRLTLLVQTPEEAIRSLAFSVRAPQNPEHRCKGTNLIGTANLQCLRTDRHRPRPFSRTQPV